MSSIADMRHTAKQHSVRRRASSSGRSSSTKRPTNRGSQRVPPSCWHSCANRDARCSTPPASTFRWQRTYVPQSRRLQLQSRLHDQLMDENQPWRSIFIPRRCIRRAGAVQPAPGRPVARASGTVLPVCQPAAVPQVQHASRLCGRSLPRRRTARAQPRLLQGGTRRVPWAPMDVAGRSHECRDRALELLLERH